MTMKITADKLLVMRTKLTAWASASHLNGKEIDSVTGLLCFLADGCEASRPYVGSFYALRESARSKARSTGLHVEEVMVAIVKGSECSEALQTVSEIFADWDGVCPIVSNFSPTAFAEGIGFTDASTVDGCGGVAYASSPWSLLPERDIFGFAEDYPSASATKHWLM